MNDKAAGFPGRLVANLAQVICNKPRQLRLLLGALISGGHVLLEDFPGTGKTTLAKALAASLEADFQRIQFTPDLLPSDILGVSIYHHQDTSFHYHPGPIFTQVLLADEINRASPRTQSALLEAMAETQVSVEGETRALDPLFFVMATQNPVEMQGTYPLPEAQMDRFMLRMNLGYLELDDEVEMLRQRRQADPLERLQAVGGRAELLAARAQAEQLEVAEELLHYIARLVRATREHPAVVMGAGPRASLALMRLARALALLDGLDFVTPEQIHEAAPAVLAHRLMLENEARFSGQTSEAVVAEVMGDIEPPR